MKYSEPRICQHCRDSNGYPKYAYGSEKDALEVAKNSREKLRVYWCRYGEGWHLTRELCRGLNQQDNYNRDA